MLFLKYFCIIRQFVFFPAASKIWGGENRRKPAVSPPRKTREKKIVLLPK